MPIPNTSFLQVVLEDTLEPNLPGPGSDRTKVKWWIDQGEIQIKIADNVAKATSIIYIKNHPEIIQKNVKAYLCVFPSLMMG